MFASFLSRSTSVLRPLLLLLFAATCTTAVIPISNGVKHHPKAFTPEETREIVKLMKTLPVQYDDRQEKSVRRTNYFDQGLTVQTADKYTWILERIRKLYSPDQSLEEFRAAIDFILMHEFDENGFFDWHVDTKPGDGTGRTDNINVMLSDRSEYVGGGLVVGMDTIPAEQGDCYSYPAYFPHKVSDITGGRRHTFIIAMKINALATSESQSRLQKMWETAEDNFKYLCATNPSESKFHLLHGEFLTALGRPDEEIDAKFADMYASTPESENYAKSFSEQGQALQQMGRSDEALGYLRMADMIRSSASRIAAECKNNQ